MSSEELREKLKPFLKGPEEEVAHFLELVDYVVGPYDQASGFQELQAHLKKRELRYAASPHGRLFYLALPPFVYPEVYFLPPSRLTVLRFTSSKPNSRCSLRVVDVDTV